MRPYVPLRFSSERERVRKRTVRAAGGRRDAPGHRRKRMRRRGRGRSGFRERKRFGREGGGTRMGVYTIKNNELAVLLTTHGAELKS